MLALVTAVLAAIPWWACSILSNVSIIAVEYLNRYSGGGSWLLALRYTWPLIILAQWCLWRSWSAAPHWLTAWMVFTVGNSLMRVAAVGLFGAGEVASWHRVVAGIGTMVLGSFILKGGLR